MSAAGRKHNVDERNLSQVSREVTRLKKLRAAVAAHAGTTVEELCNDGTVVEDMDLDDDQEEELLEGDDKKQWTAAWHHGVAEWTKHSSLLRTGAAGYKTSNRIAAEARATYGTGPCAATIRGAVARNLKSPPENPTRKSHSGCRVWWGRGMTTPWPATHTSTPHPCVQPAPSAVFYVYRRPG